MGTRSLTFVETAEGELIVCLYRQHDGYPSGHGQELADFLKGHQLINGIDMDATRDNSFNGVYEMAAALVSHFKGNKLGGFYLYPPVRDAYHGQEYNYVVTERDGKVYLLADDCSRWSWEGLPENFDGAAIEESWQ